MPADTTQKTVKVSTWEYRNAEGKRRRAYFGDVIELTDAEVERGERAGVFDQPPAGPVDTPFIAKGVVAKNLAAALADIEPRTSLPLDAGAGEVAKLHHDIQPPTAENPATGDADDDGYVELPPKVANKPTLIKWVVDHAFKDSGGRYTAEEAGELNKGQLWAIISEATVQ